TGSPSSGWLQIVGRGFAAALVGHDLISDLLPIIKVAQAGPFDRADMDEHICAAGVRLNEPEAFRCIEPFDCARRHVALLSDQATNLAQPQFIARRRHGRSAAATVSWRSGRPRVYQAMMR